MLGLRKRSLPTGKTDQKQQRDKEQWFGEDKATEDSRHWDTFLFVRTLREKCVRDWRGESDANARLYDFGWMLPLRLLIVNKKTLGAQTGCLRSQRDVALPASCLR